MLGIVSMAGNALKAFGNTHPAVKWGVIVLAFLLAAEFVGKEGVSLWVQLETARQAAAGKNAENLAKSDIVKDITPEMRPAMRLASPAMPNDGPAANDTTDKLRKRIARGRATDDDIKELDELQDDTPIPHGAELDAALAKIKDEISTYGETHARRHWEIRLLKESIREQEAAAGEKAGAQQ